MSNPYPVSIHGPKYVTIFLQLAHVRILWKEGKSMKVLFLKAPNMTAA
jgi:hypothetical protein